MFERVRSWASWQMLPHEMKQIADDELSSSFVSNILGGRYGGSSAPPGTKELLDAYTKMPWLRAVVHKVSLAVGMTPWTLHIARKKGDVSPVRIMKYQYGSSECEHG